ncbi:hypothetical protein D9M68_460430 [compost metagenome]
MDALFAGLALADVAEEAHVADQVSLGVLHRGDPHPGREGLAVAALEPQFAFPAAAQVELGQHVLQLLGLLAVGGEHARHLVEHLRRDIAADPAEGLVDLHDVAGRVGDHDRRGGVLEYRGGHAQLFLGAALVADVAGHAEQALEGAALAPHRAQAQLHRQLAAVGMQAVEDEQLGGQLAAQLGQARRVVERLAHAVHHGEHAVELPRVGQGGEQAVVQQPVAAVAERTFCRGADVVDRERAIGGEDHVADVLRQQPVALLAGLQRLAGFDLLGDVLGHPDQPADPPRFVVAEGLLADVEPVPAAVAVPPAQLAGEQLAGAEHLLQVAHASVQLCVVGMQDLFPHGLAEGAQFVAAVAEFRAQAAVVEQHAVILQVVHVEGVGQAGDHLRPEALALDQRQLDALAGGDVVDAQGHRPVVASLLGQVDLQPQIALVSQRGDDATFQLDVALAIEQRGHQLEAKAFRAHHRRLADQVLPDRLRGVHAEQAQSHLVGLGDVQALHQLQLPFGVRVQPARQRLAAVQA